jgi:protein SCO1/2
MPQRPTGRARTFAFARPLWLLVGAFLAVAAALVLWNVLRPAPYSYLSEPLSNPTVATDFTLLSASGPVHLSDWDGKVVVLFFGYTHCPDVCPTEMMQLAKITASLPSTDRERVAVAMISVDPERDTPQVMATYAHAFSPAFHGLTGTPDAIAVVAKQYYVSYQKTDQTGPDAYFMRHTASVYVLDPKRRLTLIYGGDDLASHPDHIARDLRHLLTRSS